MGLFTSTKKFESMEDLLLDHLKDLYDAEQRLTKALPKLAEAAHSLSLKSAFRDHLKETEGQIQRLKQAFQLLDKSPEAETCEAMKGLIEEGEQAINAEGNTDVKDAALIAAAQRVEHYEMAGYGSARTFAQRIGKGDIAVLLQQTLDEEKAADKKLSSLAEGDINPSAPKR